MKKAFHSAALLLLTLMVIPQQVLADSKCNQTGGSIFSSSKCKGREAHLNDLFKWQNEPVEERVIQEEAAIVVQPALRRSNMVHVAKPTSLVSLSKNTRNEPGQILVRSKNQRLSEFGHKKSAELLVTCINGSVSVEFYFPGYPMSESARPVDIAYQVNAGTPWTMTFLPTRDLFKVKTNNIASVDLFLASIASGEYLDVVASDIENTIITANFELGDIPEKLQKMTGACKT